MSTPTPMPPPSKSRPGFTCLIGLISSVMMSAMIGWLISHLYPLFNIAVISIVESFGLPAISSSFVWMGIAFIIGFVLSVLFNLVSRAIVKR